MPNFGVLKEEIGTKMPDFGILGDKNVQFWGLEKGNWNKNA